MNETIDTRLSEVIVELQCGGISLEQAREAFCDKFIAIALKKNGGNVSRTALQLGVHRNTLHNYRRQQKAMRLMR